MRDQAGLRLQSASQPFTACVPCSSGTAPYRDRYSVAPLVCVCGFSGAGKNLPEKVTADIKQLVHTISKVCLQILKPETPYVLDTISKDYTSTTTTDWELDKSHWINVIAQLQLSNLQVGGGGAGRGRGGSVHRMERGQGASRGEECWG